MGSNMPKIGTSDIAGCYLGNTEIEKVYLGGNVIYEKQSEGSPDILHLVNSKADKVSFDNIIVDN